MIYTLPADTPVIPRKSGPCQLGDPFDQTLSEGDSLMWLDGYGALSPDSADRKKDQFAMIRLPGSKDFMDPALRTGPGPKVYSMA